MSLIELFGNGADDLLVEFFGHCAAAAIAADLDAGRLDRHPDGGATLASVRSRVAEERPEVS